jgi:hypothetical protein
VTNSGFPTRAKLERGGTAAEKRRKPAPARGGRRNATYRTPSAAASRRYPGGETADVTRADGTERVPPSRDALSVVRARRGLDSKAPAAVWPNTSALAPEAAILADVEALVAAGHALWLDPLPHEQLSLDGGEWA